MSGFRCFVTPLKWAAFITPLKRVVYIILLSYLHSSLTQVREMIAIYLGIFHNKLSILA